MAVDAERVCVVPSAAPSFRLTRSADRYVSLKNPPSGCGFRSKRRINSSRAASESGIRFVSTQLQRSMFALVEQREDAAQRVRRGLHANLLAVALENLRLNGCMQPVAPAKRHHADRLGLGAAARTGDARDRQRHLRAAVAQRAFGHRARDLLADRAMFF